MSAMDGATLQVPACTLQNAPAVKRAGIAIVANDKVLHWLLAFLESWRTTNAALPVYLIPYDDNIEITTRIAQLYGATLFEECCCELDALARRLFPFGIAKRNRLRKLLSLALPLDEVIYLDVDIILFRDLRESLGLLKPRETDFIVIARTNDYVYNAKARGISYLKDAILFNDGFFVTSNRILSVQDFFDAMRDDVRTFDRVRQRGGLYAQPLTNFVVHRKGLEVVELHRRVAGASAETYHQAQGVTFERDGPRDSAGARIYFCHWPGVGRPGNLVFDAAWYELLAQAKLRAKATGLF